MNRTMIRLSIVALAVANAAHADDNLPRIRVDGFHTPHIVDGRLMAIVDAKNVVWHDDKAHLSGVTIRFVDENEVVTQTITTPVCVYDNKTKLVDSKAEIVCTSSGVRLTGEIYTIDVEKQTVAIKSKVRMKVTQPPNAKPNADEFPDTTVTSKKLEYDHRNGLAVFKTDVRMHNTRVDLTSDELSLQLNKAAAPEAQPEAAARFRIDSATAIKNVVVINNGNDASKLQKVSGDRGVYTRKTNQIVMSGNLVMLGPERSVITGKKLVIDL